MSNEKIILVSNDDGIDSVGIRAIAEELCTLGRVYVVAPDRQRSAVSQALTIEESLRVKSYNFGEGITAYSVNGTPADCVKLAICELLPSKPDLVVSGINLGQNTSVNMMYSGTVAAATEGLLFGCKSMAISLADFSADADCTVAGKYGKVIAEKLLGTQIPENVLLNVNVPNAIESDIRGIKITDCSDSVWIDRYDKRTDPFGRIYYLFAGNYRINDTRAIADDVAIANNYVSVTPVRRRFTDDDLVNQFKNIWE